MDIPLPDSPPLKEHPSIVDIPIPEDTNRYSPSVPIEDDSPEVVVPPFQLNSDDLSDIALPTSPPPPPLPPPPLAANSRSRMPEGTHTEQQQPRAIVLGKLAAKKRLLAFKQNAVTAQALAVARLKREELNQAAAGAAGLGAISKESESREQPMQLKKKPKKGVLDKARDTISEIEELKRRENEVRENMQLLYPMWGSHPSGAVTAPLLIPDVLLEGNNSRRAAKIETLVDQLLEKKSKREKRDLERRRKDEERRSRKERERAEADGGSSNGSSVPLSWSDFKRAGYKVYHFRRVKYKWDKVLEHSSRKKRRSRSRDRDKLLRREKRVSLFDSPMELKNSVVVEGAQGGELEFPSWSIRRTRAKPRIIYSLNLAQDMSRFITRRQLMDSQPMEVRHFIEQFFDSLRPKRLIKVNKDNFNEDNLLKSRSWYPKIFELNYDEKNVFPYYYEEEEEFTESEDKLVPQMEQMDCSVENENLSNENATDNELDKELEEQDRNYVADDLNPIDMSDSEEKSDLDDNSNKLKEKESEYEQDDDNEEIEPKEHMQETLASEYEQFMKMVNSDCNQEGNKESSGGGAIDMEDEWSRTTSMDRESENTISSSFDQPATKSATTKKKEKCKRKALKSRESRRKKQDSSDSSESHSSSSSRSSSTSSCTSSSSSSTSSSSSSSSSDSCSSSSESSSSTSSSDTSTSSESSDDGNKRRRKNLKKRSSVSHKKKQKGRRKKPVKRAKIKKYGKKTRSSKKKYLEELKKKKKSKNKDSSPKRKKKELERVKRQSSDDEDECPLMDETLSPEGDLVKIKEEPKSDVEDSPMELVDDQEDTSPPHHKWENSESGDETEVKIKAPERWSSPDDLAKEHSGEELEEKLNEEQESQDKGNFNSVLFKKDDQENGRVEFDPKDEAVSPPSPEYESSEEEVSKREMWEEFSRQEAGADGISSGQNVLEDQGARTPDRYSPTEELEDEEEDVIEDSEHNSSGRIDDSSQHISFGVNSASEEARMLDIPLPPPVLRQDPPETSAPPLTTFHNILQTPYGDSNRKQAEQKLPTSTNKSPVVARLTFDKQITKIKPLNVFSTEDSDSEIKDEPPDKKLIPHEEERLLSPPPQKEEPLYAEPSKEIIESIQTVDQPVDLNAGVLNDPTNPPIGDPSLLFGKRSRWSDAPLSTSQQSPIPPLEANCQSEDSKPNEESLEALEKLKVVENKTPHVEPFRDSSNEIRRSDRTSDRKRFRDHSEDRRDRRERRRSPPTSRRRRGRSRERRSRSRERRRRKSRSPRRQSESTSSRSRPCRYVSPPAHKQSRSSPPQPSGETTLQMKSNLEVSKDRSSPPLNSETISNSSDVPENVMEGRMSPLDRETDSPGRKRKISDSESPHRRSKLSPPDRRLRRSPSHNRRQDKNDFMKTSRGRRSYSPSPPPTLNQDSDKWKWRDKRQEGGPFQSPKKEETWTPPPIVDPQTNLPDSTISDSELPSSVREPLPVVTSPKRLSLDERLQLELGVDLGINKETPPPPPPLPPPRHNVQPVAHGYYYHPIPTLHDSAPPPHFYQQPPPNYQRNSGVTSANLIQPPRIEWDPTPPPVQHHRTKVLQVGNVLQVVPSEHPPINMMTQPPPPLPAQPPKQQQPPKVLKTSSDGSTSTVVQVGNMLQVLPTTQPPPQPVPATPTVTTVLPPPVTTSKAVSVAIPPPPLVQVPTGVPPPQFLATTTPTAIPPQPPLTSPTDSNSTTILVAPVAAPPPPQLVPPPVAALNSAQRKEEKERRRKEKEMRKIRKQHKAAKKLLKKKLLREKLAHANEMEKEECITLEAVTGNLSIDIEGTKGPQSLLPSPDKGILISPGFREVAMAVEASSVQVKRKSVSFADGVRPGEGTSPSGGEEHPLSPPPVKKTLKKKKKRKVKVRIIRLDGNTKAEEEDSPPPPPPPGSPPPEAYYNYSPNSGFVFPQSYPGAVAVVTKEDREEEASPAVPPPLVYPLSLSTATHR